jgi:hypothetical protein
MVRKYLLSNDVTVFPLTAEQLNSIYLAENSISMQRKKPDVDIISDILKAAEEAYPSSNFIQSLSHQYIERGGLSKKQLEGLFAKASKLDTIPPGKLATLEAEILKRPTRYKSSLPPVTPLYSKDKNVGDMITFVLTKYPQHKRVLFFKTKYDNNEVLSVSEITELKKFHAIAQKSS